ncbi:GlxA family transcriptional regulator [Duganella guangzhouensis]|nr:helix-turn-helix domain-containing protein [Duganella guangzhouensis]
MNTPTARRHRIAVIAFDGITPFHLSVPGMVFRDAQIFDLRICAADPSPLRTTAGFDITVRHTLRALTDADIVIVPTWHDDCRPAPAKLLEALRRSHKRGARLVGLCLGAFTLAEAGLLDQRRATTHWAYADTLAERYPAIAVDSEVLYVDDEILTSAGVAAGLDCCLHLLRQLCGADAANHVARQLVVAPHRQGGQAQFIERPVPASGSDDRFTQVLDWVNRHLAEHHSIDTLATRAAMSRRNFTRHFRDATGTSFKQWLLNQRVTHAQRLLETSELSMEMVAQEAGFGSALSLRQHFRAHLRTSPSDYRRQFRAGG